MKTTLMKRNKIFIISGAILFGLFIALLFWFQTMEGQPDELQNTYKIEIFNCPEIGKDKATIDTELKAALLSTPLNKDGVTSCYAPIVKIDNVEFGVPIYGMNYFRLGISSDMYLYEDRKMDEATFFEAPGDNENYIELRKKASKGWFENVDEVALDWINNKNEFIIYSSQTEKHTHNKKVWQSMIGLRGHIDSLMSLGTIEKKIEVYYFCGDFMDGMLDDDLDGIVNSKDSCRYEKGSAERNGCPEPKDTDGDGVFDKDDQCDSIPGDIKCKGCPCPPPEPCTKDSDGDGICDKDDKCKNTYGQRRYDGCPPPPPKDDDNDGIPNSKDKCRDKAGPIENDGCPYKFNVKHNPIDGKFILEGIANINEFDVSVMMQGQNGGGSRTDKFIEWSYPSKDQSILLTDIIEDPIGMTIIISIKLKDDNRTLFSKTFKNLSMICKSSGQCGFVDTSL